VLPSRNPFKGRVVGETKFEKLHKDYDTNLPCHLPAKPRRSSATRYPIEAAPRSLVGATALCDFSPFHIQLNPTPAQSFSGPEVPEIECWGKSFLGISIGAIPSRSLSLVPLAEIGEPHEESVKRKLPLHHPSYVSAIVSFFFSSSCSLSTVYLDCGPLLFVTLI
jgi:hypothetical protein